ncbi:MAG TPA: amidase family protein [Nocardioidaceae bacterium]|nr:amidase family protein [Nocardioidaceae bacterium]
MTTSRQAVEAALARISEVDGDLRAVCTPNDAALDTADALDREAADGRSRGPLHGQPIVLKDNIDTSDLLTTAGSLALADRPPPHDAPVVERIRAAGMVVVGKANLSEWANIRDAASTSGWSAYGGLTRNPYGLNRSAGGSSAGSGSAVAGRLVPFAVGTETDGSITCPAAFNGCVGIKPTVGLIPAEGIVPISHSQDTAGPMALTVHEAAQLLDVMSATDDFASHAQDGRLTGKRVGVPRAMYWGYSAAADAAAERAVALLAAEGAEIVDGTDLEAMAGFDDEHELIVLLSELRAGLAAYLPTRGGDGPQTLQDVVDFNRANDDRELAHFGQGFFEMALTMPEVGSPDYEAARAACLAKGRDEGIDRVLREHELDALLTPAYAPAIPIDLVNPEHHWGSCTQPAAMAGYPLVTVPSDLAGGLPVAVTFWGTAGSEATLIEIAHGYESARDRKQGPLPAPTLPAFV